MEQEQLFHLLLLAVAFLYAGVGHGGASGYLALMAIFSYPVDAMKPTALALNLLVSLTAFIQYGRRGYFDWKTFWPFAATSVPMAFLGGWIHVDAEFYRRLLGLLLLFPAFRFLLFDDARFRSGRDADLYGSLAIGAVIGFLSGLIGIGGGIILSPILLLLGWTDQKQTAALSAPFILVNSLAGLAGQMANGVRLQGDMWLPVAIAFGGGLAGAWLGANRFDGRVIRGMLGIVLLLASWKLLFT
jgi:uncharacterized membrane protein YfcA